jgi:CMP-N,N'-diacetyllegionaminic acid synthase
MNSDEIETPPRVLCVIPARGGSKGLPNKNLLLVGDLPLIAHPINYALQSKLVTDLIVSTDSNEIAAMAINHGATVPFMRPEHLAQDLSTTEDVLQHALNEMEKITSQNYDYCLFLTATSVFRPPGLIERGVSRLESDPSLESYFSGYKTTKNYWELQADGSWERVLPWMRDYSSRQIRKSIVREDTGIASVSRSELWRSGRRIGDKVWVEINEDEFSNIDIHSAEDLELARAAISLRSI